MTGPRDATAGLEVELRSADSALEAAWDELCDGTAAPPFARPGWVRNWWQAFAEGPMTVIAVSAAGTLRGVVPIRLRWHGLSSPANWHSNLFCPLATDPEALRAAARWTLAQRKPRSLWLRFIDAGDPILSELRAAAREQGYRTFERVMLRSPYVPTAGDWNEYEAGLSKNLRKNLRRRRKRLQESGELTFDVHTGSERLDGLLDEAFAVEASGWKGKRGSAIASRPDTRAFYVNVARWAAARGLFRLGMLRLDGKLIAFDYGVAEHGSHYSLKSGYLDSHRHLGPGAELTYRMVHHAFERRTERFDLLGDLDEFKLSWARDNWRTLCELRAFATTPGGVGARIVQVHGRALARRALRWRR